MRKSDATITNFPSRRRCPTAPDRRPEFGKHFVAAHWHCGSRQYTERPALSEYSLAITQGIAAIVELVTLACR